jgi:hypothetical protein
VQGEIPAGGVDVFACTRQVASELIRIDESHTSLVGLLYWVGFRRAEIPYDRLQRPEGTSAWSCCGTKTPLWRRVWSPIVRYPWRSQSVPTRTPSPIRDPSRIFT